MPPKITQPPSGRNYASYIDPRTTQRVTCTTDLMLAACYLAGCDQRVESFGEHMQGIPYKHQGRQRLYYPELQLRTVDGRTFVCACLSNRVKAGREDALAAAHAWCAVRDWAFLPLDAAEIRRQPRLNNARWLTYTGHNTVGITVQQRVASALADAGGTLPLVALAAAINPEEPRRHLIDILNLAFHRYIHVPITAGRIADETPVSLHATEQPERILLP